MNFKSVSSTVPEFFSNPKEDIPRVLATTPGNMMFNNNNNNKYITSHQNIYIQEDENLISIEKLKMNKLPYNKPIELDIFS